MDRCGGKRSRPNQVGGQFLVSPSDSFQRQPRVAVWDGGYLITWFGGGAEIDDDILGRNYVVPEPGTTALGLAGSPVDAGFVSAAGAEQQWFVIRWALWRRPPCAWLGSRCR